MSVKENRKPVEIKEKKGFLKRTWSDPVWSKVISAVIIAVGSVLIALAKTLYSALDLSKFNFNELATITLSYQFTVAEIFIVIIVITLLYLVIVIFKRIKNKESIVITSFNTDQKIGNFTFRELYNALLTFRLNIPDAMRANGWPNNDTLLNQFIVFQRMINTGVDIDAPGPEAMFLYFSVAPSLMSYGLVEMTNIKSQGNDDVISLRTSENGYLFLNTLERWRIFNHLKAEDENLQSKNDYPGFP